MATHSQLLLVGESFSPWTKKARWALEYCDLRFDYQEYIPTLSEPKLRMRLRQWSGSVSVPVLFTGSDTVSGSWDIACFANNTVGDGRLGDMQLIEKWNLLSEDALAEGRTRVVRSILNNNQAIEENLPLFIPKMLRRPMRFLARDAIKRLDNKYADLLNPGALNHALLMLRKGLAESSNDFLLGAFSYADIAMAVVLEVIAPIIQPTPPLGPETQKLWFDTILAEEYKDLVSWRNDLASNKTTTYSQFNTPP